MQMGETKYFEYTYEQVCRHPGKDYDYLWSAKNSYLHKHVDFYEVFFVVSGEPIHFYQGRQQTLHKNQMFIFKPGAKHHLYTEPHKSFHFSLFAKPKFIEHLLETHPYLHNIFKGRNYLYCEMTDLEFNYIYTMADSLIHQPDEDEKVYLLLSNILMIMKWYNNHFLLEQDNAYVSDILEKMHNHTFLNTTMNDIYKRYPISQRILTRDFKKHIGMTMIQYQKVQKLKYAAQLLIRSDYKITDIAGMVGYDSLSYFVRSFEQEYGMAPRKYRDSHTRK